MSDFLYNFIDGSSVTGESTFDIYRSTVNPDATYEDFLAFMQSGPQGPQGEKGADGAQGPQGEPGPKGDKGEPASNNLSELNNDAGFITNLVNDLQNYYLKTETYTQEEVNELVSQIPKFNIEVVESLPSEEISTTTVYLLKADEEGNNLYTEYIYVNEAWEILGSQKINLSNYYDKPQIDELIGDIKDNLKDIAIPLLLDNWELDGTVYKQTVTVNGLTEDSNPIIVISPVGEKATEAEINAFNCLTNDIIVSDGYITFTAKKLPIMSFTVVAKGATANGDAVATVTELVAKVSEIEQDMINKVDNTDARLSDARTPLEHNHDDKYYTETEIDDKFNVVNQNVSNNANAITQLNSDFYERVSQDRTARVPYTALRYIIDSDNEKTLRINNNGEIVMVSRENGVWKDDESEYIVTHSSINSLNDDIENLKYLADRLDIISSAHIVDLWDAKGYNNRPVRVQNGITTDLPSDCQWGIREVFWMSADFSTQHAYLIVKIIGVSSDSKIKEWYTRYDGQSWRTWECNITNSDLYELKSLSKDDVIESTNCPIREFKCYQRGKTVYAQILFGGNITSSPSALNHICTLKPIYKPAVHKMSGCMINLSTGGQVFSPATYWIINNGQIHVVFTAPNVVYGCDAYPWCTGDGLFLEWEIE